MILHQTIPEKIENDIRLGVEEFEIREAMDQLGDLVTEQQKQHILVPFSLMFIAFNPVYKVGLSGVR